MPAEPIAMRALRAASSANETEIVDPCGAEYWELGCLYAVTCESCLSRPGCAIQSTTGQCVSLSRVESTVGVEYLTSQTVGYCAANDNACSACTGSGVCYGTAGCICVSQCASQSSAALQCKESTFMKNMQMVTMMAVVAFLFVLVTYVRRSMLRSGLTGVHRLVYRERQRPNPEDNPMALKLEGWRHFMEGHKEQFEHVELQTCTVQLKVCDMEIVTDCNCDPAPRKAQQDAQEAHDQDADSRSSRASTTSARSCGSFLCVDSDETEEDAASTYAELASPSAGALRRQEP